MTAIVIGAGPNGLAAAIRMAEAGIETLVLEAADAPGGAVRTEALTLPGFRHDTFSSVYPAGAASPVFARMPLQQHGLEWVQPAVCSAQPLAGGRSIGLHRSVDATAASLGTDGRAWRDFVAPFLAQFDALRDTLLGGFPPVGGALRLTAGNPRSALRLARLVPESATSLAHRLFTSPDSAGWLYGAAAHSDVPPTRPGSAIAAAYLNLMGHAVGWPSPRGGAQALTDALVSYLQSLGGNVRTGARVTAIDSSSGVVTGVRVGEDRIAAGIVIADVMPHALVRLADLDGLYARLLRRYRYGPGTLKVDWALDGPIPWQTEELRGAGTVHVGGSEAEMLGHERPFMLLGQQSIADPTRAPQGKHTAWAYSHASGVTVEAIEDHVEHYAPGFKARILGRHVLTSADLERRNPNLIGGDVGGGSFRLRQVILRPVPRLSPYTTPVKGLYLGSAATFPGGAVHGVSGDAAARTAIKRAR